MITAFIGEGLVLGLGEKFLGFVRQRIGQSLRSSTSKMVVQKKRKKNKTTKDHR